MYSPNDDKNKDRISNMLEESDDDSDDDDEEGGRRSYGKYDANVDGRFKQKNI